MPNWTPETDRRPSIVPPEQVGTLFDAALDGVPLLLEWSGKGGFSSGLGAQDAVGYEQQSDKIGIDQTSTSDDISENKLSPNEFWRSMRNWEGGMGQKRFDVPKISQPDAYRDSAGIDIRDPGRLRLLRKTVASAPGTFSIGTNGSLGTASDSSTQGIWFISEKDVGGPTQAVTLYNLSTFTTKTLAQSNQFFDLTVAPDDTCYISASNGIFKVTSATSIVAWIASGGFSFTALRAAKQRLYGFGTPSGGVPGLYEIPTEGTAGTVVPVLKLTLAPGTACADIKEAGGLVLFAITGNQSLGPGAIYAYDGTNAPQRAATFERGEDLLMMQPVLGGTAVLILTRRQHASGEVRNVVYITSVQNNAMSPLQLIFEYPDDYDSGTAFEATSLGQHVFYGGQNDVLQGNGVGVDAYNFVVGTVGHHLQPPIVDTNNLRGISQYAGRLVFFSAQSGVMKVLTESNTDYVTVGELTTSAIDLNVDAPKQWTVIEAGCQPLAAGQKIEVYWSADQPEAADFRLAGTLTPGQTTASFPLGVISRQLTLKVKLYGTTTTTPTLVKLGVAAQMARLPKLQHSMKIRAYSRMERLDGQPLAQAQETYIHDLATHLEGLRHTGRSVWLQSPMSHHDGHADLVKVDQVVKRLLNNPAQQGGGEVSVALTNVLPDRRNLWPLAVASHSSVPIVLAATDLFEAVGGVTFSADSNLKPWTTGAGTSDKVTPATFNEGVRFPKVHATTIWDPVLYRGLPLSASAIVSPYLANLQMTIRLEFWDAADVLRKNVSSKVFTLDSVGKWYPLYIENVTTDDVASFGPLGVTARVRIESTSPVGAFALDGAQLEQARIATRWQAPPSVY